MEKDRSMLKIITLDATYFVHPRLQVRTEENREFAKQCTSWKDMRTILCDHGELRLTY